MNEVRFGQHGFDRVEVQTVQRRFVAPPRLIESRGVRSIESPVALSNRERLDALNLSSKRLLWDAKFRPRRAIGGERRDRLDKLVAPLVSRAGEAQALGQKSRLG